MNSNKRVKEGQRTKEPDGGEKTGSGASSGTLAPIWKNVPCVTPMGMSCFHANIGSPARKPLSPHLYPPRSRSQAASIERGLSELERTPMTFGVLSGAAAALF